MKFRVERDVLEEAISWAARTLPARPAFPVLAGVKISAGQDMITLSSFDYEVSSQNRFPAQVDVAGEVLVSGKMVASICKQLPKKPVDVELVDGKVKLTCGSAKFELLTMPLDDYPDLPELPPEIGTVSAKEFARAIGQVAMASSRDDTLPLLSTVKIETSGEEMTLMATDRYRLAVRKLEWQPQDVELEADALVKSRTLSEIAKSVSGNGDVTLSLNNQSAGGAIIGVEVDGRKLTSQLTDGDYPPVATLFPAETPIFAVINKAELAQALKRVSLVTDHTAQVRLSFANDTLTLEAGQGDEAQASEQLFCKFVGDESLTIVFNPSYLLDGLNALKSDFVRLSFTHPTKPSVITGQEELDAEDSDEFRYLLMPIRFAG